MKNICKLIIFILLFLPLFVYAEDFTISSQHAILYNLNDDKVIYDKDSNEKTSIASLTKITTAIVAIENIKDLDSKVTITKDDYQGIYEANLATAGFQVGEEVTYRDLLYGLLLPSGAEAAQALANNIAGGNSEFVELMNKKAKELKLKNTHYTNTTGLDDNNHYSTAKDVATVFKYAINNKDFKEIIESSKYTTSNKRLTLSSSVSRNIQSNNLGIDYILGGKTGTTEDAGLCLATIAKENKVNYLLVTTGVPIDNRGEQFQDHKIIYDYFINNYAYHNVVNKKDLLTSIKTLYIKQDKINFYAPKIITMYLNNSFSKDKLKYKYHGKDLITTKMKKGEKLGKVDIYYENKLLTTIDIILQEKPKLDIIKFLNGHKISIIVLLLIIILIVLIRRKKKIKIKVKKKKRLK